MDIKKETVVEDVKRKLDLAGVVVPLAMVKLIIDTEHETMVDYLKDGHTIEISGAFTARAKQRAYKDLHDHQRHPTMKIEANINWELKNSLMFKHGLK